MEFLLTSTSDCHGDRDLLEYTSVLRQKGFEISSVRKFNSPITYIEYTIKVNSVEDTMELINTVESPTTYIEYTIKVNSVEDMMELINTVESPIIISTSTKGDLPQIEVYDNYRE